MFRVNTGAVHPPEAAEGAVATATVPEDSPCASPPPNPSCTPTEAVAQNSAPELRGQAPLGGSTPRSGRARSEAPRLLVPRLNLPLPGDISDTPPTAYLPSQHRWASVPLLRRATATGSLDSQSSGDWLPPQLASPPQLAAPGHPLHQFGHSALMPSPFLTHGLSDSTSGDTWYTHAGDACAAAGTMFAGTADRPERSEPCVTHAESGLTAGGNSHTQVGLSADCVAAYINASHACADGAASTGAAAPSERAFLPLGEPYARPPPNVTAANSDTSEDPDTAGAHSDRTERDGASSKAGAESTKGSPHSDGTSGHANSNAENEGGASSAGSGVCSFSRTASGATLDSEDEDDGRARSCPAGFMHDSDGSACVSGDKSQPLLPIRLGGVRSAGARVWSRPVEAALACDAIREAPPPGNTEPEEKPVDEEAIVCGAVGDAPPVDTDFEDKPVAQGGVACGAIGDYPHVSAVGEAVAEESVASGACQDVQLQHGSASIPPQPGAAGGTTNAWEQCSAAKVPAPLDSPLSGGSMTADGAFEDDGRRDDDAHADLTQGGNACDSDDADEGLSSASGGLTAATSSASDPWTPRARLPKEVDDAADAAKAAPLADPRPPLSARRVQSAAGGQDGKNNTRVAAEQVLKVDAGKAAPGAAAESTLLVDPVDACSSFGVDDGSSDGMGGRVDVGAA